MTFFYRSFLSITSLISGCLLVFSTTNVLAQNSDTQKNEPLVYSADQVTYDDLKQLIILTGQVVLVSGGNTLKADRVELFADPEGYHFANAKMDQVNQSLPKRMASFQQINPDTLEKAEGKAFTIDYDGKQEILTLKGKAEIKRLTSNNQLVDEIRAPTIIYNARYEHYTAKGQDVKNNKAAASGRVRGVFMPRSTETGSGLQSSLPSITLQSEKTISSSSTINNEQ